MSRAKPMNPALKAMIDAIFPADGPDRNVLGAAGYRKAVQETMELAQVDQSIATNAMAKAERQFAALDMHLAQLAALEKALSEAAYTDARQEFRVGNSPHQSQPFNQFPVDRL